MITKAFIDLLLVPLTWMVGLIPHLTLPAIFSTGAGSIPALLQTVADSLSLMGNWIPVEVIGPCLSAILTSLGVAWAIRLVRWVQSSFTGGGGA
jgi:hypothetical protein